METALGVGAQGRGTEDLGRVATLSDASSVPSTFTLVPDVTPLITTPSSMRDTEPQRETQGHRGLCLSLLLAQQAVRSLAYLDSLEAKNLAKVL